MKLITSINGRIVKRGQDKISVLDNSLLYAEGHFETCLAIDDRIIFLQEHIDRLYRGAAVTGVDIPVSPTRLIGWLKRTCLFHHARIKKVRLTLTAGEAIRWTGKQGKPQVAITVAPHKLPERPFRLHLSEFRVDQDSVFRRIKTLSYAIHAAALKQALTYDCDDALLLNEKGQIAEVTSANLFWVKKGRIYTPPLSSGCLEGITRQVAINEAENIGHRITERNITLSRLAEADELFITSSLKLLIGVSEIITGSTSLSFQAGPITEKFINHFRQLVKLQ